MPVIEENDVKDLPVIPPITQYEYHICFHGMYFTLANMFW